MAQRLSWVGPCLLTLKKHSFDCADWRLSPEVCERTEEKLLPALGTELEVGLHDFAGRPRISGAGRHHAADNSVSAASPWLSLEG